MLVDGGVEIGAEPVGGGPELLVEVAQELLGVIGGHERKKSILLSMNKRNVKIKPAKKTNSGVGGHTLTETLNMSVSYRNTLIINMWSLGDSNP